MFTEYNNLPNHSRVWVYQSEREFTENELVVITSKATDFIEQWTRHGDDLKGSFTIRHKQFLILAVDEGFNNVSGCSIDASVRFVKQLENDLQIDLMNKLNVSFKDGDSVNIVTLSDFQKYAKEEKITSKTIVFNNMVQTKEEVESKWEVPANQSWHQRFLVK